MKVKRQKNHRRTLRFFRLAFGVQEPYHVLVDGTFILHALRHRIHIKEQLPKLLGGRATPMVTGCVCAELRRLGDKGLGAAIIAKGYYRVKCSHEEPIGAAECISSQVGKHNKRRFLVASQDAELCGALRVVPGVPLLRLNGQVPAVEEPSAESRSAAARGEANKKLPSKWETPKLPVLREREAERAAAAEAAAVPKKRKGPKGPNPLSCRKPKKRPRPAAQEPPPAKAGGATPGRSSRRVRSRKMGTRIRHAEGAAPAMGAADQQASSSSM